jgi:hypothetical protein
MSKILNDAVTRAKDGSWTFQCPGIRGSKCGAAGPDGRPFYSSGWPEKKIALARGAQHFDEHRGLAVTPSLEEFRAEHGLVAHPEDGNRAVRIEDLP